MQHFFTNIKLKKKRSFFKIFKKTAGGGVVKLETLPPRKTEISLAESLILNDITLTSFDITFLQDFFILQFLCFFIQDQISSL